MASVNLNCCEGLTIQRMLCNCNWAKKKEQEQHMYTDHHKQIVILSTPHIEFADLVAYSDIQNTDIVVFSCDSNGDLRFTSLQGRNLFKYIDIAGEYPARQSMTPPPMTGRKSVEQNTSDPPGPSAPISAREYKRSNSEHKVHPSISVPEDVAGRLFTDILPDYMQKFFIPICKQTLQGNFLQLTITWDGFASLVRSFPIQDHRKRIVSGMIVISPFSSIYNTDVNRFSVGNIVDANVQAESGVPPKHPSKPENIDN